MLGFNPRNYNLGDGVHLTMYVNKQKVIFQLTQTSLSGIQLYNPSKICMNMKELNCLIKGENLNQVFQHGRITTHPSADGFKVYRKDNVQAPPVYVTLNVRINLQKFAISICNAYRKALSYIEGQQSTISGDINALADLSVACAVYYDCSMRKAECKACRDNGKTDPYQTPHACAFENIESKHTRAKRALNMVTTNMLSSALASNGLQPPGFTMTDITETDCTMLIHAVASYNVKDYCKNLVQHHINIHHNFM